METTYAGETVAVNEDGFLADPSKWTAAIGGAIAVELGVSMSPQHWTAVNTAREEFVGAGASPGLRRLAKKSGMPIKAFYDLFPDGPAKKIARIAGIPKPKSCL